MLSSGKFTRKAVYGRKSERPTLEDVLCFYVEEVALQARFALLALEEVEQRAAQGSTETALLAQTHAFLVFAGNVSKLLFPGRPRDKELVAVTERRKLLLRAALQVDETSPLASRDLRHHLEHFDERLDKYLLNFRGLLAPYLIVPERPTSVSLEDEQTFEGDELYLMRCLDTSRLAFSFLGEEVELRPVADELARVYANARAWQEARLRPPQPAPT